MNCLQNHPTDTMPEFLCYMKNLRYLNLSGISFMGRVPRQLGKLSRLQLLELGSAYGPTFMYNFFIIKNK
jgi:hypothetical protein